MTTDFKDEQLLLENMHSYCTGKLRQHKDKESWRNYSQLYLLQCLMEEVGELINSLDKGRDIDDAFCEAADVANVAFMLADNFRIELDTTPQDGE